MLGQQALLGIPQPVLLIKPSLYTGRTRLEASLGQSFGLLGITQLFLQLIETLLAIVACGQIVFHLHQCGVELFAKLGFSDLVIQL